MSRSCCVSQRRPPLPISGPRPATPSAKIRRYDVAPLGSHRGLLMAFCNTPTLEPAQGLHLEGSKWAVQNGSSWNAFPPGDDAGEPPIRAGGWTRVIRGLGYLF